MGNFLFSYTKLCKKYFAFIRPKKIVAASPYFEAMAEVSNASNLNTLKSRTSMVFGHRGSSI